MITDIRRGIQSKVYRGFLIFIVLALAGVFSLPGLIKMTFGKKEWVMKVNNTVIDHNEYIRALMGQQELVDLFKAYYGKNADTFAQLIGIALDPHALALDKLTRDALLNQVLQSLPLSIDEEYVTQQLKNMSFLQQEVPGLVPRALVGPQGIDMYQLRAHLLRIGLTIADFESHVEQAIKRSLLLEMVYHASYINTKDIEDRFIRENARKKFSFAILPLKTMVSEEEKKETPQNTIKSFFDEKNKEEKRYFVPETRDGVVWEFDPQLYGIEVTENDIESYYNNQKTRLFIQSPTRVSVRRMIFNSMEEAQKARTEFMQNPKAFEQKAELIPLFARNTHAPEFEKAAFLLKQNEDFSSIVKTPQGFELLQRVTREPQSYKPLTAVHEEIKNSLFQRAFKKAFNADIKQLKVQSDNKQWDAFVQKKQGKKRFLDSMNNDSSQLSKTLFALRKNEYGNYVHAGRGYLVHATAIRKKHAAPFESVEQQVRKDFYKERAREALDQKLAQIKSALATQPLQDVVQKYHLELHTTDWIDPKNQEQLQQLAKKGIPATQFLSLETENAVNTFIVDEYGYVVRLEGKEPINQDEFKKQESMLKRQQIYEMRQLCGQAFVASLYRNATIKINETIEYNRQ